MIDAIDNNTYDNLHLNLKTKVKIRNVFKINISTYFPWRLTDNIFYNAYMIYIYIYKVNIYIKFKIALLRCIFIIRFLHHEKSLVD